MQNRSSKPPTKRPKRPRDINQLAALIVQKATEEPPEPEPELQPDDALRAAAATLGRRGGLKGGRRRAVTLSAERRREIARAAALARWKKKGEQ